MVKPTLDGVLLKVISAHQHLKAFHHSLGQFIDSQPYRIVIEDDPEPGMRRVRVEFHPFPPELPVLAGEFAHALRSALDHLAWQLVIDVGGTPDHDTAFPIRVDPNNRSGNPWSTPARITPVVSPAVATFIKDNQPYITGAADATGITDPALQPLGALSKIDNVDKHHQLVLVLPALIDLGIEIRSLPRMGVIYRAKLTDRITNNAAVVARLPAAKLPQNGVQVQLYGFPAIALEVEGTLIALARDDVNGRDGLVQLFERVLLDVIIRLTKEFTKL